jgi:hypothetical protein
LQGESESRSLSRNRPRYRTGGMPKKPPDAPMSEAGKPHPAHSRGVFLPRPNLGGTTSGDARPKNGMGFLISGDGRGFLIVRGGIRR